MEKEHTEMMQEIQEENRKLQVSGYEWDITLTEQDVEEHGWIRGDSLLHAFETIASAHVDSLDMGFEQMIAQNRIWVMTKIKYVVYKRVEGDDPQMLYHVTEDDLDKNQHVNNARYAVMIDETLGTSAHREVTIHFAKETVLGDEILLYTDAEKADPKAADYADGGTSQHVVGELSDSTVVFKSLVKPL